jgi:hypothetical protein
MLGFLLSVILKSTVIKIASPFYCHSDVSESMRPELAPCEPR